MLQALAGGPRGPEGPAWTGHSRIGRTGVYLPFSFDHPPTRSPRAVCRVAAPYDFFPWWQMISTPGAPFGTLGLERALAALGFDHHLSLHLHWPWISP